MSAAVATVVDPACLHVPPGRVGSFADDVCEVAERLGRPPVPEQRIAIDALTSYDRRGHWLSTSGGVELGRQNGKTSTIGVPIFLWSCLTDPDLYMWTSHRARTHLATFRDLAGSGPRSSAGLINSCDWLSRRVRQVDYENGAEAIEFVNGSRWEFLCRSVGVRGTPAKAIGFDEALMLDAETVGAMTPALATRSLRGDARALFLSSAALRRSAFLRSLRRRALARDPRLTYVGWWAAGGWAEPGCLDDECTHAMGAEGCSLDRPELRQAANPLLGRLISMGFLDEQRALLPPVEFGREHLGWQEEGDEAVDIDRWMSLADEESKPLPWPLVLGVDVSPRQMSAAVVAAGRRADGLVHVEVMAHRPGVTWLRGFLEDMQGRTGAVVHHTGGSTPVMSVVGSFDQLATDVMSQVEFAAACGVMDSLVTRAGLRHLGDQILARALEVSVRRAVGDGSFVLSRRDSASDISPAVAAAVAVGALDLMPAGSGSGGVW